MLFALIFALLFVSDGITPLGWIVAAAGVIVVVWAGRTMGRSFTPFPRPPREAELVDRGPFRYFRHPVYVGGILFFAGLSLVFSVYALVITGVLALFWVAKARREERYLLERFPGYADYKRRTLL